MPLKLFRFSLVVVIISNLLNSLNIVAIASNRIEKVASIPSIEPLPKADFDFGVILAVTGDVSLDDGPALVGGTVQTGQTVSTTKGETIIDLGRSGRIVVGPYSKVQLIITKDDIRVICIKDPCRVHVL